MRGMALLFILNLFFCGLLSADKQEWDYQAGFVHYGKENIPHVYANGTVFLNGTHIEQTLKANGDVEAIQAQIASLFVNGHIRLRNCVIHDKSFINGSLEAENCLLEEKLSIATDLIILKNCETNSITIRPSKLNRPQILDMRENTVVNGSIVFESGQGQVWTSKNSEVTGYIKGAKIYQP